MMIKKAKKIEEMNSLYVSAREFKCPKCGAEPKNPCVQTSDFPGRVMYTQHTARYRAMWAARKKDEND